MVIHADKIRWLFWLRWKMFTRGFTRDTRGVNRIIGMVLLVLFGFPFMGGIAVVTFLAYRYLPVPVNAEVLFLILTAVYLLWMVLPLFEFTVNEGLDISKLSLFPLTRAELMVSLVFSTLLDVPTIGLLMIFGAVIAGWSNSIPLALMTMLIMLIFYVQVIGCSQLVLALLMRTLQSRRFRDLSIIIIALFSSSCYLVQQLVFRGLGSTNVTENLLHISVSGYLQWLPPGMAARAIQLASTGNWLASFVWLAVLLVISILVLYLWQLIVERGVSTAESGGSVRERSRKPGTGTLRGGLAEASRIGIIGRFLSSQMFAIALKDLKYFRRDPQLQATLVQSIMSVVLLIVITLINTGGAARSFYIGRWSVLLAPAYIFLSLYSFSSNVLGLERQSLTTLFLFPVEPKHLLWGKNIVVFMLGIVEMSILVLLAAFISHAWSLVLPALAMGLAGIGVVLGCGNFSSVFFPQRIRLARKGFQSSSNLSSEGGCLRAVMSLLAFLVTLVILLPVIALMVLPLIFNVQWIWALPIPVSLLYSAIFYYEVTIRVAPRMLNKVPEILAITTRE